MDVKQLPLWRHAPVLPDGYAIHKGDNTTGLENRYFLVRGNKCVELRPIGRSMDEAIAQALRMFDYHTR